MVEKSRQQRRQEVREQLKLGHSLLAKGLPWQPRTGEIIAVGQVFRSVLADQRSPTRASEAARIAHELVETSLKARKPASERIACAKGCAYCCYAFVSVTPPEAFRLAAAVRAGRAGGLDETTVRERARPLIGRSPSERIGAKLPCPLLIDATCSVYALRPLVCRQATSLSLPACVSEFEGRDLDIQIPISSRHLEHASNVHIAFLGAMRALGLPTDALELAAALTAALVAHDAEARWLAGEDIFASVPKQVTREPHIERAITHVANALAA